MNELLSASPPLPERAAVEAVLATSEKPAGLNLELLDTDDQKTALAIMDKWKTMMEAETAEQIPLASLPPVYRADDPTRPIPAQELVKTLTTKELARLIPLSAMLDLLAPRERAFAERVFALTPAELKVKTPWVGADMPRDLVRIPEKTFAQVDAKGKPYVQSAQFVPREAYESYTRMNEQMKKDIGKEFSLDSGYRSPGMQAYEFFEYLVMDPSVDGNGFSLLENARWLALPGYSEHNAPRFTAIDLTLEGGQGAFLNADGTPMLSVQKSDHWVRSPEYAWIQQHAGEYGYHLSYPPDNAVGIEFEPWHWQYRGTSGSK